VIASSPADDVERVPLWKRHDLRDAGAVWRINRDHPAVQWVESGGADAIGAAASLLMLLENNLPIHDIHIYTANDQPIAETVIPDEPELEDMARKLLGAFCDQPEVANRILEKLPLTEPFNRNPDATRRIVEKLRA
jgi:hypothetical protein